MTEEKTDKKYNLIIGRHVPVKSPHYLLGAVEEALSYGSNALMVYLGAPQNSKRRSFNKLKKKLPEFKEILKKNKLDINNVIVHGPYLLNLANTLEEKKFQWSVKFLTEEMIRMKEVGLKTIVIHSGSALTAKPELALTQIVKGINLVFDEISEGQILLETMCGRGSEVGINFEQLKYIMDGVEQKERIGVC
jgi:deoxyribonuclease-4